MAEEMDEKGRPNDMPLEREDEDLLGAVYVVDMSAGVARWGRREGVGRRGQRRAAMG